MTTFVHKGEGGSKSPVILSTWFVHGPLPSYSFFLIFFPLHIFFFLMEIKLFLKDANVFPFSTITAHDDKPEMFHFLCNQPISFFDTKLGQM